MSDSRIETPAAEKVTVDRTVLSLAGATIAGCAVLALAPPGGTNLYPPCPFLLATGMDCPFCGGLRGTYALLQGDFASAFDHNVLVPVLFGAALVGFAWWSFLRITRGPVSVTWSRPVNRWILPTALALLGVFWIVRNLAYFPYLDSGVG